MTVERRAVPIVTKMQRGTGTTYTLWSHGRLLGHSDLGYARCFPKHRTGDFFPTERGEKLMPVVTGVRQAMLNMEKPFQDWDSVRRSDTDRESISESSGWADVAAARVYFDSLELELRAADGSVIPTEWIEVRDNEVTVSFAREGDYPTLPDPLFATEKEKELLACIEHDAAICEEWFGPDWDDDSNDRRWEEQMEFPRYQIQVALFDDAAVP